MLLLTATSEAESLFLLLHIVATSGYCDARSLIPGTTFRPAQTGQPVVPLITERTTSAILVLNSCPQSRHLKRAFSPLPAGTSKADNLFLLLHMAAASGYCDARSLIPGTTFRPAQTGQPVVPLITERTTSAILVLNSCPQSRHLKRAFSPLPAGTSKADNLFLLLHMAAASGYCDARSLIPGTTFRPAQTGQPVVPLITERTTFWITASNSCPQSGQTNVSFLPLPVVTSKARCLSFSLSIAATFGQATARQFSLTALYGISMPRVGTGAQAAQLQELACIIIFMLVFMIDFSFVINKNKKSSHPSLF